MPNLLSSPSSNAFSQNAVTPKASTSSPFNPQTPQTDQFGRLTSLMPKASSGINFGAVTNGNVSSLGVRAATPTSNVKAPVTTIPASQTAPQSQQPVPQTAQQPTFAGPGNTGSIIPSSGSYQPTQTAQPVVSPIQPGGSSLTTNGAPTNAGTNNPASIVSLLTGGQTQASQGLNNIQNQLQQTSAASSPAATQDQAQLNQYGAGNIPIGQQAQGIFNNYANQYQQVANNAAQGGIGMLTGGALNPIALGRAGAIESQAANEQNAIAQAGQLALQGTNQQLTAQNQAANASNAAAGAANTQQANVQSGLNDAGGIAATSQGQQLGALGQAAGNVPGALQYGAYGGGGNLAPQSVATQLAQLVNSGQMTSDQANTQMTSLYGGAGSTFLQQALTGAPGATGGAGATGAVNPNFNYVQSAQNQASQGQLGPQSTQASLDYSNLQSALQNVPSFEQTGVPVINAIGNLMSSMGLFGSGAQSSTQALNSAISTTRAAVETALSTQYGGTPSDYSSQATSLFPPNLTPAQLSAGMKQFQIQMGIRQQAYGSPGTTPITTSVGGASTASTDYNF